MGLRGVVLLLAVVAAGLMGLPAVEPAPSAHAHHAAGATAFAKHAPASMREYALLRLQEALRLPAPTFGERPSRGGSRREAPEFMLQLQRRVAHPDGVLRVPVSQGSVLPHGARIVRSFFEQEPTDEQVLRFNVSGLDDTERVLGAELRVFRLRRTRAPMLLRVYQVEAGRSAGAGAAADEHRLLGVQVAPARAAPGWHSFNVLPAVSAWLAGDAPNLGLLVTTSTLDGAPARASAFARRARHVPRRQPLLVLYDGEIPPSASEAELPPGPHSHAPAVSGNEVEDTYEDDDTDYGSDDYIEDKEPERSAEGDSTEYNSNQRPEGTRRHGRRRRDASPTAEPPRRRQRHGSAGTLPSAAGTEEALNVTAVATDTLCSKHNLWVEFDEIGWSNWIIAPTGYNAYQCYGECPYPLIPALSPSNHATVQSLVHALRLQEDVRPPCCTPEKLEGLSLLYTNEQDVVVLKIYEDMVAGTCGCH